MTWQHTDIAVAPRAGRADELRVEASGHRMALGDMRGNRARRLTNFRRTIAERMACVAVAILPDDHPTTELATE